MKVVKNIKPQVQKVTKKVTSDLSKSKEFKTYFGIGLFGGLFAYFLIMLKFGGFGSLESILTLLLCGVLGIIAGVLPVFLEMQFGSKASFFRSWSMVLLLLFFFPFVRNYMAPFIYGYLFGLLWKARKTGLKDY